MQVPSLFVNLVKSNFLGKFKYNQREVALKAHSHESGSYPDSRNVDRILLQANPDLIRIPFTCANEENGSDAALVYTADSIHLHEINKARIQAITTLPVAIFDFFILHSQILDLGLALPPPPPPPPSFHNQYLSTLRAIASDRFQLKRNGLTNPYVKESPSFTLHPTSSSHRTKLPEIYFHVNAMGYYPLTRKDKHPFTAALNPLDPDRIHLSRWIARIRIRSGSPCNWITCERDRSGFGPDTGAHVNTA